MRRRRPHPGQADWCGRRQGPLARSAGSGSQRRSSPRAIWRARDRPAALRAEGRAKAAQGNCAESTEPRRRRLINTNAANHPCFVRRNKHWGSSLRAPSVAGDLPPPQRWTGFPQPPATLLPPNHARQACGPAARPARRSVAPRQQQQPGLRAASSSSAERGQIRRPIFVHRPGHTVDASRATRQNHNTIGRGARHWPLMFIPVPYR